MDENEQVVDTLDGLDEALDALNNPAEDEADDSVSSTANDVGTDGTDGQSDSQENNAESGNSNTDDVQNTSSKANKAFAEQRIQNKITMQALEKILTKAGLDPALARNPQAVLQMFDEADVAEQAQQMNVPAQLLSRINALENQNKAQTEQRLYNAAVTGFQGVKDKYNLTDAELNNFATQLQEAGINPFAREIDFDREYRINNLDKIIENERKAAIKDALAKQTKATQHSTVPSRATGKPAEVDDGEKINTMAQFDMLLSKMK